jgi:chromosome segregation ATPase
MDKEPTIRDVIEVIYELSSHIDQRFSDVDQRFSGLDKKIISIDKRFDKLEERFNKLESRFDKLEERFNKLESRFDKLEERVVRIEATMVTKEYLDDKLADLRGDIVLLVRKEDKKLGAVVQELVDQKITTQKTANKILAMEPFPQSPFGNR